MADTKELADRWKYLYAEYLPSLAKAKDPAQSKWPVNLDHCFARIVLDNAVGRDAPWTQVVKSPAVKYMTVGQFESAIGLAEKIANGEADLVELDERSLILRGKRSKVGSKRKANTDQGEKADVKAKKRKGDETISSYFLPSPSSPKTKSVPDETNSKDGKARRSDDLPPIFEPENMSAQLEKIQTSSLTPFRKQTLSLLCQIPRGRYSTYAALSDYISATSHKTCARAVGNAMRNNPFAPEVPCHRILAADGSLGGFGGHWGEEGKFAGKKRELLKSEGVGFDSRGRVKGPVFREFT